MCYINNNTMLPPLMYTILCMNLYVHMYIYVYTYM